jgi:hypothetical protein
MKEICCEYFYLLGYSTVRSAENQPTFRRNMSPSPLWWIKPDKKHNACNNQLGLVLASWWFLAWLIRSWRRERYFPPKRQLIFDGLHGIMSNNYRCENLILHMFTCWTLRWNCMWRKNIVFQTVPLHGDQIETLCTSTKYLIACK